jgi:hypothetical protein
LITVAQWNEVERLRTEHHSERNPEAPIDLIPPVVFDSFGRRMAMVRKYRDGRCERYYYSYPTAWGRSHRVPRMRAHAGELEGLITASIAAFIDDRQHLRSALIEAGKTGPELDAISARAEVACRRMQNARAEQHAAILAALILRVEISRERSKAILSLPQLERFLHWDGLDFFAAAKPVKGERPATHVIDVPSTAVRLARSFRLPIEPRAPNSTDRPDTKLVLLIKQARHAQRLVDTERWEPVSALAHRMSRNTAHFMKLIRLNYLAPDIVTAILDGTQPPNLTRRALLDTSIPTDWPTQRKLFGFSEQPPLQTSERY